MNTHQDSYTLVMKFIRDQSLQEGATLPSEESIAASIDCQADEVTNGLREAESRGKLQYHPDGQFTVMPRHAHQDTEAFSFSATARKYHDSLETRVTETSIRLPHDDHPYSENENRAHAALKLGDGDPFIVIERVRLIHGEAHVIHRSYLNPKRFPKTFLDDHDFSQESLIHTYHEKFTLLSRDTVLHARKVFNPEIVLLNNNGLRNINDAAVLDVRQKLYAEDDTSNDRFVLEYMQATWVGFDYEILDRPPPSKGSKPQPAG